MILSQSKLATLFFKIKASKYGVSKLPYKLDPPVAPLKAIAAAAKTLQKFFILKIFQNQFVANKIKNDLVIFERYYCMLILKSEEI